MKELEMRLTRDMQEMELRLKHDLTVRLGSMMVVAIGVVAAFGELLSGVILSKLLSLVVLC